jgi:putative SOS response-associated peptidase YedK
VRGRDDEWKREGKEKTPHYFFRKDSKPIFFAGIYEEDQFCLITEEAKENISRIHHRQPVIISQTDINRYLNLELQGSTFLKECNKPDLMFYEVSKDVNKPTNNTASLIQKYLVN